jgi:hypothetical protein
MTQSGGEKDPQSPAPAAPSDAEELLERSRGRGDRLRVGALLCLLRVGEAMARAAVDFQLEGDLRGAQFLDHFINDRERIALVLCTRAGSGTCPWRSRS